ncbi:acyl carrier protein [Pseudomonas fakonensis]|uniref:Acyl carrier protein n=1 Tax=Pseudomonas fakonensis TaxID=2842355 RepID=A0ABX8NAJ2_9PSED|nr:acyl carrier protein [Pseudomonas fakonensis]QXH53378.1 acyl carrier protein [Pseudomonas fakonensis]
MSTEDDIETSVKKIISEKLDISFPDITNAASFTDDLGADSLDTVELIMDLEDTFDVQIKEEDAEKLTTVQQVVDYIKKNAKGS